MAESVNHPSHYNAGKYEVIDVLEDWNCGFHDGNVIKYVARYRHKNGLEDLKKARWYLDRLIGNLEKGNTDVEVRSEGDCGQCGAERSAADDDHRDLSAVHPCGGDDAPGPGEERGEQSGDPVAENDVRYYGDTSDSHPLRK